MKTDPMIRTIDVRDRNGRVTGTKEVVTYQGLLSRAHNEGLKRVSTELVQAPTDANERTAIAKACVETTKGVFEAFGDANPGNVNSFIVPHLIRMAETRAKARALRDAVNVGILSAEELEGEESPANPEPARSSRNGGNGAPREEENTANGRGSAEDPLVPITENQRRYLFRILATLGYQGDDAQEYLKTRFAIKSLSTVSKAEAIGFIAQLLDDTGSASHAPTQR